MALTAIFTRYRQFFFIFMSVSFLFFGIQGISTITIYKERQDDAYAMLRNSMPKLLFIDMITFESDSYVSEQEFFYLLGMIPHSSVTADHIVKGIFYLFCKDQFAAITLSFKQTTVGVSLHVTLKSKWILEKVIIKGILLGKDTYRHYYAIDPGEVFDKNKHAYSVQKIVDVLKQQGFLQSAVHDELYYDQQEKTVIVSLELRKGDQFTIGKVATTLHTSNNSEILSLHKEIQNFYSSRLAGKAYSRESINALTQEARHLLHQKGFFDNTIELQETVHRSEKKVDLCIAIEAGPKREFVFVGNQFFSHDQLYEMLLSFGGSTALLSASFLAQEIMQHYKKKGFLSITIDTQEEGDRYFFLIHEGMRAQIQDIKLIGVTHFDNDSVKKQCFHTLLNGGYYEDDCVLKGLNTLEDWYKKDGFWHMTVVKKSIEVLKDAYYCLLLVIDEGRPSYLTTVIVDGCDDTGADFSFIMPQVKDTPTLFTSNTLHDHQQMLEKYLYNHGYIHSVLEPEVIHSPGEVTVRWRIQADKKDYYFGKIVVVGNHQFPFTCVLRELTFKEGDVWDTKHFEASLLRLKELAVFDHIHMHSAHTQPSFHEKPVILKIHKDDPFEFRMRTGLGVEYAGKPHTYKGITYKTGATAMVKNVFNRADRITFDADLTRYERSISLQYWRPWLLYAPVRTLFQGYNNKFYYPGIVDGRRNLYEVVQQGMLIGLTRKWLHINAATIFGIEWMETRMSSECIDGIFSAQIARAINFEPWLLDKKIPYVMCEPTVFIDYLDNKLYPTQGSLSIFSLKAMIPLDRVNLNAYFVKILMEQSLYRSFRSLVLATRIRFGHIFHRVFSSIMPSERFYLGGVNSIRSYETDRCPPLGVVKDSQGKTFLVPQGGKTLFNLNLELRFPLYQMIAGAVFQDFGFLTGGSLRHVVKQDLLAGTGFGLRLITPIGPLRFDIAWKWHVPEKRLSSYAWFLTLGNIF